MWYVLVAGAALLVGAAWAVSSPVGSSPDDDFHLTNAWCPPPLESSGCEVLSLPGGAVGVLVPRLVAEPQECYAFEPFVSAACQPDQRPDDLVVSDRVNEAYPGPYYRIMHLFVGPDVGRSVLVMRMVNVAVAVGLLAGLVLLGAPAQRRLLTYACLAGVVPLGLFVIASVNPTSWALAGITTAWFATHLLVTTSTHRGVLIASVLFSLGAALAIVSRGDAAAFVGLVTVAALLPHGRNALSRPARLTLPVIAGAIGLVVFASTSQSGVVTSGLGDRFSDRSSTSVLASNVVEMPAYLAGLFGYPYGGDIGGLGWLDTEMPAITVVAASAVAIGLLFAGLATMTPWKGTAYALLAGVMVGLPLLVLQLSLNVVGENVQPRYVLPLLPALIGTAVLGRIPTHSLSMRGGQTVVAFVLLVAAHAAALQANIRRYVTGAETGGINLNENIEWWWPGLPSPMITWIVGSLAFAVVAAALFFVEDRRPTEITQPGQGHGG